MATGRKWLAIICIFIYAVLNTGSSATALVWAPAANKGLVVAIQPTHFTLQLSPAQQTILDINITSIGSANWRTGDFYLQTVLPGTENNYPLPPAIPQESWSNENETLSYQANWQQINFGESFNFRLPITAPVNPPAGGGQYRFYLQPRIADQTLNDLITVDLKVGKTQTVMPVLPAKRIEVSLADQNISLFEGPYKLAEFVTSTGKPDMETPAGRYIINKKLTDVMSDAIHLRLPYWMELRDLNGVYEGYGIHGLPYQLVQPANYREGKIYNGYQYYSDGKLYTGYSLLGEPMTQGCVVLAVADARLVFNWAEPDKTLVNIK